MKRFARLCLAFLVAFSLVISQLAPIAQAEELTEATQDPETEESTSQYASESVDTDPIFDGCYRLVNGERRYLFGNYVDTSVFWNFWITMDTVIARGSVSMDDLAKNEYIWEPSTFHYTNRFTKDGKFYFCVPRDDGVDVYYCANGGGAVKQGGYNYSQFQYTNIPAFVSIGAAEYFYKHKALQNETDLITDYLPPGYSYNDNLGLKLGSSVEVGTYDENIGYPINFDYKGNLLSMNTARSSTWDFYKDANGNAITRTAEEEKYNIEIFLNFDLKNDVLNNFANGFSADFEELQMPARALSYFDGPANSCSCIYENWGFTMERAFHYFRDKGSLKMDDFLAANTYYFNSKNLNVWARYYYLDDAGEKHFGDWVKWSKEGLSVVHEDTATGNESTVEDAVPYGPEYKSSYLEKEQGYDADEQKFTIDGITINVSPYFESQDDDPEYYPVATDSPSGDNGSSGSGDNSGDNGSSGSGIFSQIGEILGNLIGGIVELFVGLLKALSNSIYKITKSIGDFLASISNVSDIFGTVFGWMPGEIVALISLAILACIVCRVLGR